MVGDLVGIGVDWGSSNIRAWAFAADGRAVGAASLSLGLAEARKRGFEPVVASLLAELGPVTQGLPVVFCGMIGARDGFAEAGYVECPATCGAVLGAARRLMDGAWTILPGLICRQGGVDVLRGEETQVLSFLQQGQQGLFCLPGTHSKWLQLTAGRVAAFRTHVTGDLFQAIRSASVFGSVAVAGPFDGAAFGSGIDASASPALTQILFRARAERVTGGFSGEQAHWFLSGLLIGAELRAERAGLTADAPVTLLADGALAQLYSFAFNRLGIPFQAQSAEAAVRAGLVLALQELTKRLAAAP